MKLINTDDIKYQMLYKENFLSGTGVEAQAVWKSDIDAMPAVDAVPVVWCKDCKYRIVNEHFGEKGYMKLKAICDLDTGDPFELGRNAEDDDWYCADGERKDDAVD